MVLYPDTVNFADIQWRGVTLVTVDRIATRDIVSFDDSSRHPVFADATQVKTIVKIRSELSGITPTVDISQAPFNEVPMPGTMGLLTCTLIAGRGGQVSGGDTRMSCTAVVMACTHEVQAGGKRPGVVRTVILVALLTPGISDPLTFESLTG